MRAEVTTPLVVLFDVDETLIDTGGSGARSWKAAFESVYGIQADVGEHSAAGETDAQVARATFRAALGRDPAPAELGKLFAKYLLHLADDILTSRQYRVLPGVERLLRRLGEAGVTLGLVSGNMEGAARTKLIPANLNRFFVFGAYGSDSPDRAVLTRMGIDKARHLHAHLTSAQVHVVGDTPRDIQAARAQGAVAVGVATGQYSAANLEAAGADHVLRSLEDPFPGL